MDKQLTRAGLVAVAALLLVGWLALPRSQSLASVPLPDTWTGQRLERDGVAVAFEVRAVGDKGALNEGDFADVRFKVSDLASGQPLADLAPGAWLDPAQTQVGSDSEQSCKSRAALFLKSSIGARPLLDLNSYYLLVMNQDASVSVIDPSVSLGGTTSTLGRIGLVAAPMDWVALKDNRRVFVSQPSAGEVAVIDAQQFRRVASIAAGNQPVRVALQPDERLLWVGNNASDPALAGVTLIDPGTLQAVKFLATGRGHHEIAFSNDSRHAFVSNRDDGTLSVIDIASRTQVAQLKTGGQPLAVAYSALSQAVYVADGSTGTVTVVDARSHRVRTLIHSQPGLGPIRFSRDGRWGIVLNTLENRAVVIDAATDSLVHDLEVSAEPWQVNFTQAYAYVRGLGSPKVSMINLSSLGEGRTPITQVFEAGAAAPRQAGDLPLASSMASSRDENSVFVVNPVDNTTYFYAEGMNAPMSGYLNRGQQARAALVIDHSLREVAPGVYSARVKLPPAGRFDVAFLLNQPSIIHCFSAQVLPGAVADPRLAQPKVDFLLKRRTVTLGSPYVARFRIAQDSGRVPRRGVADVQVRYYLAPTSQLRVVPAREVGDGLYEAALDLNQSGAWYLHVRAPSLGANFDDKTYASVRVLPAPGQ
ncbi:YncE family protein [Pseudomonas abieticivorans]|uniref:YncE family protein n=1 Tax=Pseudomonas abieticivorans TaxID=2931382 RepID=UPI0020BF62A7|nr:cytochrome D1 domain-containing protein [Pseudomonas sp. PIA16]